ncbi:hypothetical protein [Methylopila sp. 73B]|uniref:hypothetical protein n=1 Tax=Methylopila sp. 73B TaxID=1120792 RepID=UPI00046608E5|nr:hypothetical protein [Methylopila sp. 73B]
MKLAAEEITIKIGLERITLRPTLRAALRLERRHEGLAVLVSKIQDGDLFAIADVLREHSSTWSDVPSFIESLGAPHGLYAGVDHLIPALVAHVYALAGVDITAEQNDQTDAEGDPRSGTRRDGFAAHLVDLFEVATGWLGWSPDTAWNATPAEIMAARRGLVAWTNAQRGGAPKKPDTRSLDDKWRDLASRWTTRVEAA